jgi:diacylglycerol kinase family enzyme
MSSTAVQPLPSEEPLPVPRPRPPFVVVLNPRSGANACNEVRADITQVLGEAGRNFEFIEADTDGLLAACRRAAQAAAERGGVLVAVGGDGTLNSAAQAALAHDVPFGVIAQGTFNLFARQHGLPLEAADATRALLEAEVVPVDVGLVNQRVFLVNASLGLYPRVLEDREQFKQRLGRYRWVALLSGIVSLLNWRRQLVLEIELDGQLHHLRTPTLFVGNNREQLARVGVDSAIAAVAGEGGLVGLAPRPQGRWAKLRLLWRGLVGSLGESEEVDSFAFRSLTVKTHSRRKVTVATDGEINRMVPPLRFTVSPRPLRLLKPRADATAPTSEAGGA